MLKWELRKLLNRVTVLSVAILMLLNLVTVLVLYGDEGGERGQLIREARAELIDSYNSDRDEYDKAYARYKEKKAEFNNWMIIGEGMFKWDNELIDLEDYGDSQLWGDVLLEIERAEKYKADIDKVLREAYARIRDMGNRRGNYTYEYNVNIILKYEETVGIEITPSDILGWNEFFALVSPTIFLLSALIIVSVQLFLGEKQARFTSILHISKYGEAHTRLAKLGAIFISSTILTVIFTLTPLVVLRFTTGLSDASCVMQALESFEFCPIRLTLAEYLIVHLTVRIAVFFVFSLLCAVIGQLSGSYVVSLGLTFVFLAINAVLPRGFFDTAFVNFYFERYRAVNLFGLHVEASLFSAVIFAVVTAILSVAMMSAAINTKEYKIIGRFVKLLERARKLDIQSKSQKLKPHCHGIFAWEMQKLVLNPRSLIVLIILIAARCAIQNAYFTPIMTETEAVYRSYLEDVTDLGGRLDAETDEYIDDEENYIANALAEYNQATTSYANGEISAEEYHEISSRKNYAESVGEGFAKLKRQQAYISAQSAKTDNAGYADADGVKKLLNLDFDVVFSVVILMLYADTFSSEHSSGFAAIMRATKRGRGKTFCMKYLSAILTTAVLQLIFICCDIILIAENYPMNGMSFSILSVEDFATLTLDIPIWAYILTCKVCGILGAILLTSLAVGISELTSNTLVGIMTLFAVILSPYLMSVFGLNIAKSINVQNLLSPTIPKDLPKLALYLILTTVIAILSARKWEFGSFKPKMKTRKIK